MGYIFATITKRPIPARRTIAIESGIQNVGMAITVVTLTIDQVFREIHCISRSQVHAMFIDLSLGSGPF